MNDQEKLQRVREQVAEMILDESLTEDQLADAILSLPDIGVISDEQTHPTIIGGTVFLYKIGQEIGYKSDDKSGFVRLIGRGK